MSQDVEARLRKLEDIEEIKQLQAQYIDYLNYANWDEIANLFSEDGGVEIPSGSAKGRAAVTKHFREKVGVNHIGKEGPFVVHPIISVDGDKAKGNWLLYIQFSLPHKLSSGGPFQSMDSAPDWMQGYYDMEYVRENGKWKISLLKWTCRLWSPRAQ